MSQQTLDKVVLLQVQPIPQPAPTPPLPGPIVNPTDNNDIAKDLQAWEVAQLNLQQDKDLLQKLLLMLHTMKNALFGCQEVINQMMTINGDKIAGLSAVDNIDSDLRSELQTAQTDYNNAINGSPNSDDFTPTPAQQAALKDLVATIADVQAFLNWQSSLPPSQQVIDPADNKNIQDAISNVQTAFEGTWGNNGNDSNSMGYLVNEWVAQANSSGSTNPNMQNVQNGFQTINQSTSALSTTTNTNLQFTTEQYKQYMGILQSTQDAYLKFTAASVQNQKSN